MKTRYILFSVLVGMSVFFSSSCSLGLEPFTGKQSDLPQVTIQFSQIASGADRSVSRAIVQGGGFLYIRTIGGPTGDKGPFYGPYPVSANSNFITTDIPAGQFSSMWILYSAEVLDGSYVIDYGVVGYPFTALMALPDSDFISFAGTNTPTSQNLGDFFAGRVSFGEKQNVTLQAGKTTNISMTLVPVTGTGTSININFADGANQIFDSPQLIKKFYKLDCTANPAAGPIKTVHSALIFQTSPYANMLQKIDFYDRNGKLLSYTTSGGPTLVSGMTYILEVASFPSILDANGNVEVYMYLEYSGSISGGFQVSPL